MKKYSPHHPQIILPLSVAYTGTYQPSCVTLTIHPLSPSPSPSGKKTLYTSVFPYHPLLHRFLRFWIASQDLVSPAWRAPQCGCTPRPRQIPYYAHQRFSVVVQLRPAGNFSKKNRVPMPCIAFFFLLSLLLLFLLLSTSKDQNQMKRNESFFFFSFFDRFLYVLLLTLREGEKSFMGNEVFINWLES